MSKIKDRKESRPGHRERRYRSGTVLLVVLALAGSKADISAPLLVAGTPASGVFYRLDENSQSTQAGHGKQNLRRGNGFHPDRDHRGIAVAHQASIGSTIAPSRASRRVYLNPETGALQGTDVPIGLALDPADVRRYRQIFSLQDSGHWGDADKLIAELEDLRLLGYVWQERLLHPTAYRASYHELRDWLADYGDHRGADRIHRLALRRLPDGAERPASPRMPKRLATAHLETLAIRSGVVAPGGETVSVPDWARKPILDLLRAGRPGTALKRLNQKRFASKLSIEAYDWLRTRIAAYCYFDGNLSTASALARASARRSGDVLPYAHWISGLAAFRSKAWDEAAAHFAVAAADEHQSPWQAAAAAYWAARASEKSAKTAEADRWLGVAARFPRTFYGLLATRRLELDLDFRFAGDRLTPAGLAALASIPSGLRAIGLVQVGLNDLAEWELRSIHAHDQEALASAQIALAEEGGLPWLALHIGNAVPHPAGGTYDTGLYPLPSWRPRGGFQIDRALIYAFVRQESRFDPRAVSHRGATGLMQLMPRTARHVLARADIPVPNTRRETLFDPEINLTLGQAYIESLLNEPDIAGNLFHVAIAYNAGPANLARWQRSMDMDDPLLFIETIPYGQTRAFVEKIMTNYWIYRMRLGQPIPSLEAVAAGRWPIYIEMDEGPEQVAFYDQSSR